MTTASHGPYVFEPYRLDPRERTLARGLEQVPLAPRVFDLLTVLVQHAGRLVEKRELLDLVWEDVEVEEGSLTRAISTLRQILGRMPEGGLFIETVAKRGYRFTARVRDTGAASAPAAAAVHARALPGWLAETATVAFVGRDAERARMRAAWDRAKDGRRQLLLLGGEPGIGKTRLSMEFARECARQEAAVLPGRTEEETLIPYQPFVEALNWHVRTCDAADLRAQIAAIGGGAELDAFVPALRLRGIDPPPLAAMSPEGQRYRLFEAVADVLAAASRRAPLLLVFDDLHWADKGTLLMLRHVMRAPGHARLLIVATYRENELGPADPFMELLIDLRREPGVERVLLGGLAVADIRRLVETIAGPDAPVQLAERVADGTGGNPFFATEVLRHLVETGSIDRLRASSGTDASGLGLSDGIKEVVGRRLSRLGESCRRVLALAAVIGRAFDLAVLESLADVSEDALLDALEEASRAQLVIETDAARLRFAFTHALIRETLYGELGSARRARLHRRVAESIERLAEGSGYAPLADLAYHFARAATSGPVDKAIDYATRAGDRAAHALAHEEAARFYDMALQALALRAPAPDADARRMDLHVRRARAFGALGLWKLEIAELELAGSHVPPEDALARCEIALAVSMAAYLLFDLPLVRRHSRDALRLAAHLQRPDLEAKAMSWLARAEHAEGNTEAALDIDRRVLALAPGILTATDTLGPLSLYLAGRSAEALGTGRDRLARARASRDTSVIMLSLSHEGLNLTAAGRYAEAAAVFDEARAFGRTYGAIPMLARATAMAAGLHLAVFDFERADALQHEACEIARGTGFTPPIVSAGIDTLLTCARRHDPGRAEGLLEQTSAAAASTAGWHQWLWQLRLCQARAELALERGALDVAIEDATAAIDASRRRVRPKYEALGLVTRATARHRAGRTREAIQDARDAVAVARALDDPAILLLALDAMLALEADAQLAVDAAVATNRIATALSDAAWRDRFRASEVVQRLQRFAAA